MKISDILAKSMGAEAAQELADGLCHDLAIHLQILPTGNMLITRNTAFTKAVIKALRIEIDFEIDGQSMTARNCAHVNIETANHDI